MVSIKEIISPHSEAGSFVRSAGGGPGMFCNPGSNLADTGEKVLKTPLAGGMSKGGVIPCCTYRETRASSSCVSWMYSAGGRGARGGGMGGVDAVKLEVLPADCVGVPLGRAARSSASYLAFSNAFSSRADKIFAPVGI
jgi:hypothetical protein